MKKKPFLNFVACETMGAAIGHTAGLARADFSPRRRYTLDVVCNMKKEDLLKILRTNLEQHVEMFQEALEGYYKSAREKCEEAIKDLESKKSNSVSIRLHPPTSHARDYERAIRMLETTVDETIEMNEGDFATLVDDDWHWTHEFVVSNSRYSQKLSSYGTSKGLL